MNFIEWDDFAKIDMRVGTILHAEEFPEAKKKAYKLKVDLGEIGIKNSSAQITDLYRIQDLIGKQVLCVVNFKPKKIGPFLSEVLVTGFYSEENKVILATVDKKIKNGSKLA